MWKQNLVFLENFEKIVKPCSPFSLENVCKYKYKHMQIQIQIWKIQIRQRVEMNYVKAKPFPPLSWKFWEHCKWKCLENATKFRRNLGISYYSWTMLGTALEKAESGAGQAGWASQCIKLGLQWNSESREKSRNFASTLFWGSESESCKSTPVSSKLDTRRLTGSKFWLTPPLSSSGSEMAG